MAGTEPIILVIASGGAGRSGTLAYSLPRPVLALSTFEQALNAYQTGDLVRAELICREASRARAPDPNCLHLLGMILLDAGKAGVAITYLDQALSINNADAGLHNTKGNALSALHRHDEAIESFTTALRLAPGHGAIRLNRAAAFQSIGSHDQALSEARRAETEGADPVDAAFVIALALRGRSDLLASLQHLEAIVAARPDHAAAWQNIGEIAFLHGDLPRSEAALVRARSLAPGNADIAIGLAVTLGRSGRLEEALRLYDEALRQKPNHADALANRGITWLRAGFPDNAYADLRAASELAPANVRAARAMLAASLYLSDISPETHIDLHRQFGQRFATPRASRPAIKNAEPDRPLRLGFVSADFRQHPVARNLRPLLERISPEVFELCAFADVPTPDNMTRALKPLFKEWHDISPLGDASAATAIAEAGIDIMLLLAGHFDDNRPLIAVHGAAPIQISFHDPATSGLAAMDYIIADPVLAPRSHAGLFAERVIRLPSFYVHAPIADRPQSRRRADQRFVFGCFNNPAKIGENTLALWRTLLRQNPSAHLLLKYHRQYDDPRTRQRVVDALADCAAHVHFAARTDETADHLVLYNEIDVALDPFPFSGSTTTFESLSMGVPVITKAGPLMQSRWSASILAQVGLQDFVADSDSRYLEIARDCIKRQSELANTRISLTQRVESSRLCAADRYARHFQRLMRAVWRQACGRTGSN